MMSDLFIALDADGSGSLGLQELFYGLSQVVRGTKEQKAAFYFSLYDMDNSGEMDKDEVRCRNATVKQCETALLTSSVPILRSFKC